MVSDSADSIFDRLKEVVDKRSSSVHSNSHEHHQKSSTHPDFIIEENPIVIGDEPKNSRARKSNNEDVSRTKKKTKKDLQEKINKKNDKERKKIIQKISRIDSSLKRMESKPSKKALQKIVSKVNNLKFDIIQGMGKEKKNVHRFSELERAIKMIEAKIKLIHTKTPARIIHASPSKSLIKKEISKRINPLKEKILKEKAIEKRINLLAKSQKQIIPILEKINKPTVKSTQKDKDLEKSTKFQEKSALKLDKIQSDIINGKEREISLAKAVEILTKTQEEINKKMNEINMRIERSKELPGKEENKVTAKSGKKEKQQPKKEVDADLEEQKHDSIFEDVLKDEAPKEKLHASIFTNVSDKIDDNSGLSPFHEAAIEEVNTKTASSIDQEPHVSVEYNQTIKDAMDIMIKSELIEVPVTQNGKVIGALSRAKIADYFRSKSKNMDSSEKKILMKDIESLSVSRIMNTRPSIVKPNDTLNTVIRQMASNNTENAVVVSNGTPKGIITKESIARKVISAGAPEAVSSGTIETGFDRLLAIVEKEKKISTEKAAKLLNTKRETIESWASILEDHGLIKIEYPIVGTIELIKK